MRSFTTTMEYEKSHIVNIQCILCHLLTFSSSSNKEKRIIFITNVNVYLVFYSYYLLRFIQCSSFTLTSYQNVI